MKIQINFYGIFVDFCKFYGNPCNKTKKIFAIYAVINKVL
jgi:hypothetical protein